MLYFRKNHFSLSTFYYHLPPYFLQAGIQYWMVLTPGGEWPLFLSDAQRWLCLRGCGMKHRLLTSAWSGWAITVTSLNSAFLYDLLFGITNLMLHKFHHSGIPQSLQSFLGGSHSQSVRFDKRKNLVSLLHIDTRFLGVPFRSVATVPHNVSNNLKTKI